MEEIVTVDVLPNLKDDPSHSIEHFNCVMNHAKKAVEHLDIDDSIKDAIIVAAYLHDVDDMKLVVNKCTTHDSWTEYVLDKAKIPNRDMIIKMIDLVSCSKNGDNRDDDLPMYYYIPRYCDRLEAIGQKGIERCIQFGSHANRPMYDSDTKRVYNKEELYEVATQERYQLYTKGLIKNTTTIDHFYDKILHIKLPEWMDNDYLKMMFENESNYIEDYIINYWIGLDE